MNAAFDFRIRPADLTDVTDDDAWCRLRLALWPDCRPDRHATEREIFQRSAGVVLLAVDDAGHAFAFAEVSVRRDHVTGSSTPETPYLEGWFVEADRRGRGIGRALVEAACDWARQAGFRELASDTEINNLPSQAAHHRLGFQEVERTISYLKHL